MLTLVLGTVLASLDSSFVPIAFPDMIEDLDTSTGTVVWVALGYLIAATGPMLFFARIGDAKGYTPLLRWGLTLYGAAMAACALAPDVSTLIAIRLVQGLGMALFLPATFSLASRVYPPEERGRALGILASANAAGFILGPIFAGWLLDSYDWRTLFFTRIPLAVAVVALAFVALKRERIEAPARPASQLDVAGAGLLTVSIFGLLFGLNRLPVEDGYREPVVWALFLLGIVLLFVFVRTERRAESPLVDVELYRKSPDFAKASIAFGAIFASFPVYLFILPLVLISGMEVRAWNAGMLLAVVALITFVVSPWAGRLSDRFGAAILCCSGALLMLVGYLMLLAVEADSGGARLLVPMVLFGFGTGLFFSPNNRLLMLSVPAQQAGTASGMIGTVRQTGYAVGFAVMASLFVVVQDTLEHGWTRRGLVALSPPEAHALTEIFEQGGIMSPEVLIRILHLGAILGAALALLTLVYSWPGLRFDRRRHSLAVGGAALLATAGIALYATGGEARLTGLGVASGSPPAGALPPAVAPFAMARREAVEVPDWEAPVLVGARAVFVHYCAVCHGADARGIPGRGVDLTASAFLRELSDSALTDYLRSGRAANDPRNQTGLSMPGMKTLPSFSEANYRQVIAYLREEIG